MRGKDTRGSIVAVADDMFYRQGFEATSFGDVAQAVGISRGNFYHHFKTKDSILEAVVERRLDATRAMLDDWEAASDDPAERICCFVRILVTNGPSIMAHGCPVGTLCTELAKLGHPQLPAAAEIFDLFAQWLERQFAALGVEDPATRAFHVLVFSQGAATLAAALRDEAAVRREVDRMCDWVRQGAPL